VGVEVFLGLSNGEARTVNSYNDKIFWEPQKEPNPHLLLSGSSGSGKTETLKVLCHELKRQGVPLLIFDFHNDLYWLMLACCYILSAKGMLTLGKSGHSVLFELNEQQDLFTTDDNIYPNVKFLTNLNENTGAFEMGTFYLEIRCNGYRGSIVPYIKEEIEYLAELIVPIKSKHKFDITSLMQSMDYTHRFHRLYDLLEFRNIRNDREEREYFERRIKSALDLVAKLKGTVKDEREGHTKVF